MLQGTEEVESVRVGIIVSMGGLILQEVQEGLARGM